MKILNKIARWWKNLWQNQAQKEFDVKTIESDLMAAALTEWVNIYQGKPAWADDDVESFNFAKYLCNETARLTTLALGIAVEGSARAEWIQKIINTYISRMTEEMCEKACAFGSVILKPNGESIDYVMPYNFVPTSKDDDGNIDGGIFFDYYYDEKEDYYYTRLEWHRFETVAPATDRLYRVTNKTYRSLSANAIGKPYPFNKTIWKWMEEDAVIANVEKPLFSIFKMPFANNIDLGSNMGCSLYSNAEKELKNLDIALSRLGDEIFDSQKKIFMGDMLVMEPGTTVKGRIAPGGVVDKTGKKLPRYIHILPGSNDGNEYHEVNPTLQTDERTKGINYFLNLVGIKCGYSPGQFVLDGKSGCITATQVESDDRETIQTIKQIRDSFQTATDNLCYALDKYADLYNLAPVGIYEINYDFGDITYNWEEDRARHWQYVLSGKYPLWRYYVQFEGMSEEEAKTVVAEAKGENDTGGLFEE